jgi:uncharacterized RDD family membrane protein YckC
LIDGFLLLPINLPMGFILRDWLIRIGGDPSSLTGQLMNSAIGGTIWIVAYFVVHGYLLANYGQTVGKWFLNTQIVDENNLLLPFGRLLCWRYIPIWFASMIPVIGVFLALANVLLIFRANRKCLHDEIAGTKVISLKRKASYLARELTPEYV